LKTESTGAPLFTGFYACDSKILNDMEKVKWSVIATVSITGAGG
jgi:S-adenosylmethionine/arginine decarboxylase-like enzyme